jgi:DNA primase
MPLFNYIKSKLSITDIISEYIQLKQLGSYWKGKCPFHAEKDASFTVSPEKQIFYCFGCHATGDLIAFIAKTENLSQFEAAKHLIDRYQIHIPEEIKKQGSFRQLTEHTDKKDKYFKLCEEVANFANKKLLENHAAKTYLLDRAIDEKQIDLFKIGYLSGGLRFINSLVKEMANKNFLVKDLIENGIVMEGQSVLYSPFEERIIFPIKDSLGRYCGFGGRIFRDTDQRAKYYNSKETELFSKGKLLFGLDLAKKEMQKTGKAFLVEGYTDCIAMVKHGYTNTVATLGTACTQEHLKTLSRYIHTLYVLYDGDGAGQKAILRLTQLCWDVNLELSVIKLPAQHDPASFLQENENLDNLIKSSSDIFSFFIDSLGTDFLKSPLAEKLALSDKIAQVIAKINDSFKQEILIQRAAIVMQMPQESIKNLIFQQKKQLSGSKKEYILENSTESDFEGSIASEIPQKEASFQVPLLEERIFSAIINNMDKVDKFFIEDDLIEYFSDYIQILLKKFNDFVKSADCPNKECFNKFLAILNEFDRNWVTQCSLKCGQEVTREIFDQLVLHFCKQNWKQIIQDIKIKISKAKQQGDNKKFKELFALFEKLKTGIQTRGLI